MRDFENQHTIKAISPTFCFRHFSPSFPLKATGRNLSPSSWLQWFHSVLLCPPPSQLVIGPQSLMSKLFYIYFPPKNGPFYNCNEENGLTRFLVNVQSSAGSNSLGVSYGGHASVITNGPQPGTGEPRFRCTGPSPRQPELPVVKMSVLSSSLMGGASQDMCQSAAPMGRDFCLW